MRVPLIASSAAVLLAACASSKPEEKAAAPAPQASVEVHNTGTPGEAAAVSTRSLTATVLAVDQASRRLTLQTPDGQSETVVVPPEVKRFNEVAAGDTINIEVREGLLFEYQPAGSMAVQPQAVVAGGRTDPNSPPGAAAAAAVQSTVTVVAIDAPNRVVTVQGPDGNKMHVKAGSNVSIEKLAVGDRLLATYVAEVALSLEKKKAY